MSLDFSHRSIAAVKISIDFRKCRPDKCILDTGITKTPELKWCKGQCPFIKTFCWGVSHSVQWCLDRTPAIIVHLSLAFFRRRIMNSMWKWRQNCNQKMGGKEIIITRERD